MEQSVDHHRFREELFPDASTTDAIKTADETTVPDQLQLARCSAMKQHPTSSAPVDRHLRKGFHTAGTWRAPCTLCEPAGSRHVALHDIMTTDRRAASLTATAALGMLEPGWQNVPLFSHPQLDAVKATP